MAKQQQLSVKRIAIDKANQTVVIAVGLASFIVIFCLIASKSLLEQRAYQGRVIEKKEAARETSETNIQEVNKLKDAYVAFSSQPINVLSGSSSSKEDNGGDNARITLDSLPSKYDYPALTSSVEKLMLGKGYRISEIAGKDDELAQLEAGSSPAPQPIEMPVEFSIEQPPTAVFTALDLLERSIRPMQVQVLKVETAQDNDPKISIKFKSYYQPSKNFNVKSEVVQ